MMIVDATGSLERHAISSDNDARGGCEGMKRGVLVGLI